MHFQGEFDIIVPALAFAAMVSMQVFFNELPGYQLPVYETILKTGVSMIHLVELRKPLARGSTWSP